MHVSQSALLLQYYASGIGHCTALHCQEERKRERGNSYCLSALIIVFVCFCFVLFSNELARCDDDDIDVKRLFTLNSFVAGCNW